MAGVIACLPLNTLDNVARDRPRRLHRAPARLPSLVHTVSASTAPKPATAERPQSMNGKLVENWNFINLLHYLKLQGVDVLQRYRETPGHSARGKRPPQSIKIRTPLF